jgi:hypothetical protein
VFWGNEQLDASGDAGFSADQSGAMEIDNHLMDGGRGGLEVTLDVGFGGGLPEHARIDVDEGQVLALLVGEASWGGAASAV